MRIRTNPAEVRLALALAERIGTRPAARQLDVPVVTLNRWVQAQKKIGPDWPTLDMDRAWLAGAEDRRRHRLRLYESRRRAEAGEPPPIIDATGTHRRLQALMWMGWTCDTLAARSGHWGTGTAIREILSRPTVTRANADRVRALFDELCMTPGPSSRARLRAMSKGWLGPLAWDDIDDPAEVPAGVPGDVADDLVDEVVVARVLAGERVECTDAEKDAVLDAADAHGRTCNSLATQQGWNLQRERERRAAATRTDDEEAA